MCAAVEWAEVISKLATPIIGTVSAFYVYLQYQRAQKWKANDLAQTLLQKLDSDQCLTLALDWGVGPLIIPEQYRPLFSPNEKEELPALMQHDPSVLAEAMLPKLKESTLKNPSGLVYRYCFIKLFSYLDNIYKLLDDGQIGVENISEIIYWLEMIRDYKYAPTGMDGKTIFQPSLYKWSYQNVILLGKRLDIADWS
jgi:hypothetical protein